jgi:opacity protein-like surface antigen
MKRTLAIALSTLALAATSIQAQSLAPQPSFIDHVPLDASQWNGSTGSSTAIAASGRDLPQPSFVDYVLIEPDGTSVGSRSMSAAAHGFPKPSFMDYADVAEDPRAPSRGYAQAGRALR